MRGKWFNRLLWLIVALAAAASLAAGWQRHRLEAANRRVEVAVNYDDVLSLAAREGTTPARLLELLRERGATAVLLKERVLADLGNAVRVMPGWQLLQDPLYRQAFSGQLRPDYTYLLAADRSVYQQVAPQARLKLPAVQLLTNEEHGLYLVGTSLPSGVPADLGLGFPAPVLTDIERLGLHFIPQLRTWSEAKEDQIEAVLDLVPKQGLSLFAFNDGILPGYPGRLNALAAGVRKLGVPVAQVEFFPQEGLTPLIRLLDKRAVRLHSIAAKDMLDYSPAGAVDRYLLAAGERDMRVLLVRFFYPVQAPDLLAYNLDYIQRLTGSLAAQGFSTGAAEPFGALPVSGWALLLMGLGVVAGGMLWLDALGLRRLSVGLGLLAVLALAVLLGAGKAELARKLFALGASVVFPTLSLTLFVRREALPPARALVRLLAITFVSILGGLLVAVLLANVGFMLKLDQFAGVKAAHLLPLALLTIVWWLWPERAHWRERVEGLLRERPTVGWLLLAGILAVGGFIYLTRTGNEASSVSGLELQVRGILDRVLGVRPRTKEFLLGYPALLLALRLGYRDRYLPLFWLAAIGQISLVNTYAHIHTPLAVSMERSLNGLWVGLLIGLLLLLARHCLARWERSSRT